MSDPTTKVHDLEFYFHGGDPCFVTYTEGRDTYDEDDVRIRIQNRERPDALQETIIQVAQLNYRKVSTRIEEEDRGGLWLTGRDVPEAQSADEEALATPPGHRPRRGGHPN